MFSLNFFGFDELFESKVMLNLVIESLALFFELFFSNFGLFLEMFEVFFSFISGAVGLSCEFDGVLNIFFLAFKLFLQF